MIRASNTENSIVLRIDGNTEENFVSLSKEVKALVKKVKDPVISIKLNEVAKSIKPIGKKDKVTDNHLVNIMQYYDLVNELKSL